MYLDECRKRRADRVDRARKWEKRTAAEIVAAMAHSERAAEVLHQWINANRMEYHRPPPLTIANEGIVAPHPLHSGGFGNPEPGTVRYQNPSIMAAPISVTYWSCRLGTANRQMIRGDSGHGRPLDRMRSWGYLQ